MHSIILPHHFGIKVQLFHQDLCYVYFSYWNEEVTDKCAYTPQVYISLFAEGHFLYTCKFVNLSQTIRKNQEAFKNIN